MRTSRLFLFPALLLLNLVAGCVVIPLPPPTPLPTEVLPAQAGQLKAEAGLSGLMHSSAEIGMNFLGGGVDLQASYGLNDRIELGAKASTVSLGRNVGLQGAYRVLSTPRADVGLVGGISGSYGSGMYSTDDCDASGNCTTDEHQYRYVSIAPNLGVRGVYHLSDVVSVGGLVRGSYATVAWSEGTGDDGTGKSLFWLEPMAALTWTASKRADFGFGVGGYTSGDGFAPSATFSLAYRFGGRP